MSRLYYYHRNLLKSVFAADLSKNQFNYFVYILHTMYETRSLMVSIDYDHLQVLSSTKKPLAVIRHNLCRIQEKVLVRISDIPFFREYNVYQDHVNITIDPTYEYLVNPDDQNKCNIDFDVLLGINAVHAKVLALMLSPYISQGTAVYDIDTLHRSLTKTIRATGDLTLNIIKPSVGFLKNTFPNLIVDYVRKPNEAGTQIIAAVFAFDTSDHTALENLNTARPHYGDITSSHISSHDNDITLSYNSEMLYHLCFQSFTKIEFNLILTLLYLSQIEKHSASIKEIKTISKDSHVDISPVVKNLASLEDKSRKISFKIDSSIKTVNLFSKFTVKNDKLYFTFNDALNDLFTNTSAVAPLSTLLDFSSVRSKIIAMMLYASSGLIYLSVDDLRFIFDYHAVKPHNLLHETLRLPDKELPLVFPDLQKKPYKVKLKVKGIVYCFYTAEDPDVSNHINKKLYELAVDDLTNDIPIIKCPYCGIPLVRNKERKDGKTKITWLHAYGPSCDMTYNDYRSIVRATNVINNSHIGNHSDLIEAIKRDLDLK